MVFKNQEQIVSNGLTPELQQKRKDILDMLTVALDAVNPYNAVKRVFIDTQLVFEAETFDLSNFDNMYLVGFGKASVGMAQAVLDSVAVTQGVVVTNDPSATAAADTTEVVAGGHPIPNEGSIQGAKRVMDIVEQCDDQDLLLVVISGGGSALLCYPRVNLADLQATTNLLLRSGADINEINTIRKHLSYVKGGQLIKGAKGVVVSLVISDIVGDPLEFIASGPTSPDSTTFSDAQKVLEKYELWNTIPDAVHKVIEKGVQGAIDETPKPGDRVFDTVYNFIVANNERACTSAVEQAQRLGYNAKVASMSVTGEARHVGKELIKTAQSYHRKGETMVVIAGGETTVTVTGDGRGGRNQELVLGSIETIAGTDLVVASFATDGIDGNCDAAGALADGFTVERAHKKGLLPQRFLETNNSYEFFAQLHDLFITGPTGTNVMDIQIIVT